MGNNTALGTVFSHQSIRSASNLTFINDEAWYGSGYGIIVTGADDTKLTNNVIVQNCIAAYNNKSGIALVQGVNTASISGNTVYNNNADRTTMYQSGIHVFGNQVNGAGIVIEHNEIYNTYWDGVNPLGNGVGTHIDECAGNPGPIVRYNKIHDNQQAGIMIEHTKSNAQIYNNIAYNNGPESAPWGAGIVIFRGTQGTTVYNNTLYGNNVGLACIGTLSGDPINNNIFKNNIATGNITELYAFQGGSNDGAYGTGNVYTYNDFGVAGTNFISWAGSNYSTYSSWYSVYAAANGNTVQSDPLFRSASGGDFRLQSTSPAIDAGTNVGLTQDFAGVPIPVGLGYDMGAFEFFDNSRPSPPTGLY
jgi:parallel beta-helix repeat protein